MLCSNLLLCEISLQFSYMSVYVIGSKVGQSRSNCIVSVYLFCLDGCMYSKPLEELCVHFTVSSVHKFLFASQRDYLGLPFSSELLMVVVEYNVHFSEFKRHNRSFVYYRRILPLILFFVMDIMMQIFHEQESWAEDSGLSFCSPPPTSHSIPS